MVRKLYVVVPDDPAKTFTRYFLDDVEAELWFGGYVHGLGGAWYLLPAAPRREVESVHALPDSDFVARQVNGLYDVCVRHPAFAYAQPVDVVVVEVFPGSEAGYQVHGKSRDGRFTEDIWEADAGNLDVRVQAFIDHVLGGREVPVMRLA